MKKFLLIAVVMVMAFAANAQIEKGAVLLSGGSNLSFMSISPDNGDSFSRFSLNTKVGYFLIDNLGAGLRLDYNKQDEWSETIIGLFGRYYVNGNIIVGANFASYKENNEGRWDPSGVGLGIEGGYAAFIGKTFAVEPTLNLDLISGDYDQTRFGLNVALTLYLGRN
ncbi:autotransporter domain-containing protein [Chryseosolibacter indicus]|uniref:Outer membrane beta-barrel protein n=1 Tax=Chryseosolibacter indicus TaxID=2782351 RepID=A0ABS5VL80_9BACT|nr:autotransporter domain-containing protein [Chryseosolibacter indicus]MBT1701861.1 outer membrane beta-barrel protein [Chryseosolibacter indicus]